MDVSTVSVPNTHNVRVKFYPLPNYVPGPEAGVGRTFPQLKYMEIPGLASRRRSGELGIAQAAFQFHELFTFSGSVDANVAVVTYEYFDKNPNPIKSPVDRMKLGGTAIHEAGHGFGLYHTTFIDWDIMHAWDGQGGFGIPSEIGILAGTDGQLDNSNLIYLLEQYDRQLQLESQPSSPGDARGLEGTIGPILIVETEEDPAQVFLESIAFAPTLADGVGKNQRNKLLNIRNSGDQDLIVHNILLDDNAQASFAVHQLNFPIVISPGEALALNIVFDPSMPGAAAGQLAIRTNAIPPGLANSGEYVFNLIGNGVDPNGGLAAVWMSGSNNAGGAVLGNESVIGLFVTNESSEPIDVEAVVTSGAEQFSIDPPDLVLQPLESVVIPVRFTPSNAGLQIGSISVKPKNALVDPIVLTVVGTGIRGNVGVNTELQWGTDFVHVESGSLQQTFVSSFDGSFSISVPELSPFSIVVFDPVSGLVAHSSGISRVGGASQDITSPLQFRRARHQTPTATVSPTILRLRSAVTSPERTATVTGFQILRKSSKASIRSTASPSRSASWPA